MAREVLKGSPYKALSQAFDVRVLPGQVGLVIAAAGIGKTVLLVHIALDAMLRGESVLHVTLHDTVDHVRTHYDEAFRASAASGDDGEARDWSRALVAAERHRMIHSYVGRVFDVSHLHQNLTMLREVAQFTPSLVVIDGLDEPAAAACAEPLAALARSLNVPIWATLRSASRRAELPAEVREFAEIGVRLNPEPRALRVSVLRGGEESELLPVSLDPTTMLVQQTERAMTRVSAVSASDCSMYSGGAKGAEAAFGAAAARFGLHEVNFTFDGHLQERTEGAYRLSPRELAAGDVSLVYVSRRLRRTYTTEGTLLRKVLQLLWHMVSRSQKVFVVGAIQEDGTVVGGTGWSVELARMWNKDLWVFDQDQLGWFHWSGHEWVPGTPVIDVLHVTGTGTRYLTEAGHRAIDELFERSFSG